MKNIAAATALLMAVGCGGMELATEEDHFLERVWVTHFDGEGGPRVDWVAPEELPPESDGHYTGFSFVMVAVWDGAKPHETALCHEFGHAYIHRHRVLGIQDGDSRHESPVFRAGGQVQRCEEWLRVQDEAGLIPASMYP